MGILFQSTVRDFIAALTENLGQTSAGDPALAPFAAELRGIRTDAVQRGPLPRLSGSIMSHLEYAMANVACDDGLKAPVLAAAQTLDWSLTYAGGGLDGTLARGMMSAQAAGTYGCFASQSVATGQFLIAPHVTYPLHTHAAREIYYVVSGEIGIQHGVGGQMTTVAAGQYSITPAGRVHALQTGPEPVLILYVWIDDLTCPVWWWSEGETGNWSRAEWRRNGSDPWHKVSSEPVTPDVWALAHGP